MAKTDRMIGIYLFEIDQREFNQCNQKGTIFGNKQLEIGISETEFFTLDSDIPPVVIKAFFIEDNALVKTYKLLTDKRDYPKASHKVILTVKENCLTSPDLDRLQSFLLVKNGKLSIQIKDKVLLADIPTESLSDGYYPSFWFSNVLDLY